MTDSTFAYVARVDSPLGLLTLASDGEALCGLWLEGQRFFPRTLPLTCAEKELPVFDEARRWLDVYFRGREPDFFPPIRLEGTPFQRRIWALLRAIPYGTTVTYGELARRLSAQTDSPRVSARAVGGAVARNPVSILVPCHRVVGADGALTGYAGGLERKRRLLELERIVF